MDFPYWVSGNVLSVMFDRVNHKTKDLTLTINTHIWGTL